MARKAEEERLRFEAKDLFMKNTLEYVDNRLKIIRRKEVLKQREAERIEEDRVARRVADRIERRDARIARQEMRESIIMKWEDEWAEWVRKDEIEEAKRKFHHDKMYVYIKEPKLFKIKNYF